MITLEVPMCPQCKQGRTLKEGVDRLDQSNNVHYPVTTLYCECGYKRWTAPAPGVTWEYDDIVDRDPVTQKINIMKMPRRNK